MGTIVGRLTLVTLLLAPSGISLSDSTPSDEAHDDIRALMEITGAAALGTQMMNQLLAPLKQSMPSVPEEYWARFHNRVDPSEMMELVVPIYAKYFTNDEIKQLLAFYRTPLGQKVIATLPAVMHESMAAGQAWGEQIGREIVKELKAEGY